jgi:hypothetical protein
VKYTLSSFASAIFHLPVAQRPVITTAAGDTVHDAFNASVDFHKEVTGFEASDIEVTNAQVTLTGALTVHVDPVSNGDVTVKVIANAVTAGNFASDVFKTYYKELASLISDNTDANAPMLVYPSPVGDILHVEIPKRLTLPVDIKLMNSSGAIVIHKKLVVAESTLELNNIPPGLYILKAIDVTGNVISGKVIKR